MTIETQKREVVDLYIEKKQEASIRWQFSSILKSVWIDKEIKSPFWWWDKINKYIDSYLSDSKSETQEETKDWDSISNNINSQIWWLKWWVDLAILTATLPFTCSYFKELTELLEIIKQDRIELSRLKSNIEAWLDFDATETSNNQIENNIEYNDWSYRARINQSIGSMLDEDKKNPIKYVRGGDDLSEGWLDCSGMIDYVIKQAGGSIVSNGRITWRNTAREYFKNHNTQVLLSETESTKNNKTESKDIVKNRFKDLNLKKWDLLHRDSIDTSYKRSTWAIPSLKKDWKAHRIHHIAMIESVNYNDGTLNIIESNWSQWVTKSTVDPRHWLKKVWNKKSELYVSKVDYSTYFPNDWGSNQMLA